MTSVIKSKCEALSFRSFLEAENGLRDEERSEAQVEQWRQEKKDEEKGGKCVNADGAKGHTTRMALLRGNLSFGRKWSTSREEKGRGYREGALSKQIEGDDFSRQRRAVQ